TTGIEEAGLVRLAAAVERGSEHVLGEAIVRDSQVRGLDLPDVTDFEAFAGRGVRGTVEGRSVLIGTARLMQEQGVDTSALTARAQALTAQARTVVLVAVDGEAAGVIAIADTLKAGAAAAVAGLQAQGIDVV